ncbi:MAG TPA: hypothetical protein VEZ90_13960 [Blastocatellia bacterium]|nr:hypothetical protein [Blastocatellia bacterium]
MEQVSGQTTPTQFDRLRSQHPKFTYDRFNFAHENGGIRASFHFRLEPDIEFQPEILIQIPASLNAVDSAKLENVVFHLGLVEMLSYWKAACSPEIEIRAGSLKPDQIDWWTDLLRNGMGEFFYVNKIDPKRSDLVRITATGGALPTVPGTVSPAQVKSQTAGETQSKRPLVLASGGKDTALTLHFLKESGTAFDCLMLNPTRAATDLVLQAKCPPPVVVSREIDKRLLQLNKEGYLNGHTPFSAYLSFLGVMNAVLFGHDYVIASNERSSNEGNVKFLNSQVNHQYSKSVDFEGKFRQYVSRYLTPAVEYFSLVRPLYEIQIMLLFSDYPEFFPVFRSCNRGQAQNAWCGVCPKCVCIFTLAHPFLSHGDLTGIFGRDLFQMESTVDMLKQLTGVAGQKPFECVGTLEETVAALHLSAAKLKKERRELPLALRWAEKEALPRYPDASVLARRILSDWGNENYLPPDYAERLKSKLKQKVARLLD